MFSQARSQEQSAKTEPMITVRWGGFHHRLNQEMLSQATDEHGPRTKHEPRTNTSHGHTRTNTDKHEPRTNTDKHEPRTNTDEHGHTRTNTSHGQHGQTRTNTNSERGNCQLETGKSRTDTILRCALPGSARCHPSRRVSRRSAANSSVN